MERVEPSLHTFAFSCRYQVEDVEQDDNGQKQ